MPNNKKDRPKEAAALRYDPERDQAPRVVAAGRGSVAEEILARASESDIPVHVDPELAHTLNLLGLERDIPPELYTVTAQILLFVAEIDKKTLS